MFHYAFNPSGFYSSAPPRRSVDSADLFTSIDKKHKIYTKKTVETAVNFEFMPRYAVQVEGPRIRTDRRLIADVQKITDQVLLARLRRPAFWSTKSSIFSSLSARPDASWIPHRVRQRSTY